MKNQNAITMVSLIITIVVMLILTAVPVSVVLKGGLLDAAKDATKQTESQIIFKEIISSIVQNHYGQIDINTTYQSAKSSLEPQVKSVSELTNGVFTVEGNNGTYTFTITENEIIQGLQQNDDIITP